MIIQTLRLPFRAPFRWDAIAAFLRDRAINRVQWFENGAFVRSVSDSRVAIEPAEDDALRLTVPEELDPKTITACARRTFDLDADPATIDKHLRRDPLLRPLLRRRPGPRVPGAWDPFEVAIRGIVGQQITVRAATTIMNRLAPVITPERLAEMEIAGMPRSRADAIRNFARAVAGDPAVLTKGATLDETIERLTALRGIGPWTAHYIAMRALGEPDAFPHSDLGLRKAAAALGITNLLERAERWRPYRAYAAIALWESL